MTRPRRDDLRHAVQSLTERQRLLLQLTRLDGLSTDDLALVLGCQEAQVAGELRAAECGLERHLSSGAAAAQEG